MAYAGEGSAVAGRGGLRAAGALRAEPAASAAAVAFDTDARRSLDPTPEIECLRHRLPPGAIASAQRLAAMRGVGADEVLIAAGQISEERYFRALALSLAVPFAELDAIPRAACPLSDDGLMVAWRAGLLPLRHEGALVWAVALRGLAARSLVALVAAHPELRRRIVISSPAHIRRFVERHGREALARRAVDWLRTQRPMRSAAPLRWRFPFGAAALIAGLCILAAMAPLAAAIGVQIAISAAFLAWSGFRLLAAARSAVRPAAPPDAAIPDHALPAYTVIVPMYRETVTLAGLVACLRSLDYPKEKLEVLLVVEADDPPTRLTLETMNLGPPFQVVYPPMRGPRTKPKALNAALPFARGELTVIYDAEDRPEPDQLRRAAAAFRADRGGRLACVQARLAIDNGRESWLAALFAAEYAGQFDVLMPGLSAMELPMPLGGSSNHFRTDFLRDAGAWDPFNVTEDADLGMRLARLGYGLRVIESTTHEEAPARLGAWVRQRTRWFKGWMQTWCVHMRRPWRLWRDLGWAGFAAFQLLIIGTVAAALLQPATLALILAAFAWEGWPGGGAGLAWFHWTALAAGYGTSIVLAFAGLVRRRLLWIAWVLPLMLVHWALLSYAAWRAVYQFARDPYRWEKTEHRLARPPRARSDSSSPAARDEGRVSEIKAERRGRIVRLPRSAFRKSATVS